MKLNLPNFKTGRVLVIGDLMLDRYWYGGTSRISAEAPVPVEKVREIEQRAGGAGNVALNIAALQGEVDLLPLVGSDKSTSTFKTLLADLNVGCQFVAPEGCSTITKLRVMSRNQQLIRFDFEDIFSKASSDELFEPFQKALTACNVVLLSDYDKGTYPEQGTKQPRTVSQIGIHISINVK